MCPFVTRRICEFFLQSLAVGVLENVNRYICFISREAVREHLCLNVQ